MAQGIFLEQAGDLDINKERAVALGGVTVASGRGGVRLRADRAVIWYRQGGKRDALGLPIQEIYAEGHVIFELGDDTLMADRLYFHFGLFEGKAEGVRLALRNLTKWIEEEDKVDYGRGVYRGPRRGAGSVQEVYISADEILIRGPFLYEASDAEVTTCDYGEPHYSLRAAWLEVSEGRNVRIRGATARFLGVPVLYWPSLTWNMDWNPYVPVVRPGTSSEFGTFVESEWTLYAGDGIRLRADVDYYEKRGTGYGAQLRYRAKEMRGELQTYSIRDRGDDELYLPPGESMERERWRVRWLHRHTLGFDWELYTEYSQSSDRNFLPEYFEHEFRESKDQESLLYLKKIRDHWGMTFLYQARRNDFQSTVEALPRTTLEIVKAPIVKIPLIGRPIYYSQRTELANLRFRPDDEFVRTGIDVDRNGVFFPKSAGGPFDLDAPILGTYDPAVYDLDGDGIPEFQPRVRSWRFDSFHEARLPIPMGPLTLTPYATGRYTFYERTLLSDDSADRAQTGAGARLDTQVHKTFDVKIPSLRVTGLRHVFSPSVQYSFRYLSTKGPEGFIQFDAIDRLDEMEAITLILRNRLQTRIAARPNAKEGGPKTLDVLDLEIEASYFPSRRDRLTRRRFSNIDFDLRTNALPYLSLYSRAGLDPEQGTFETWSVGGLTIKPGSYMLGLSLRKFQPALLATGNDRSERHLIWGGNVHLTPKWAVEARGQYDVRARQVVHQSYSIKRFFHKWVLVVSVGIDEGRDEKSISAYFTLRDFDSPPRIVIGGRQDFPGLPDVQ